MFDFNKIASEYDKYYESDTGKEIDKIEKKCVADVLENIPRGKTLEVGAGTGHWTEFFVSAGFDVTGIDIAKDMLSVAKSKNIKAEFFYADVCDLPFGDETFETVFAVTSLEFVPDREKAFREIKRVLKKNGYFVIAGLTASKYNLIRKYNSDTFAEASFIDENFISDLQKLFKILTIESCLQINGKELAKRQFVSKNHIEKQDIFAVIKAMKE